MGETQSGCTQSRGKESNRLKLGQRIASNSYLHIERELTGPTARKSAQDAIEGSFAAPTVVRFAGCPIKTERHMGHGFAVFAHQRPDPFEVPAIGYKAAFQVQLCHRSDKFSEIRMKCWLATSEHDLLDAHRVARVSGHPRKEFKGKKV